MNVERYLQMLEDYVWPMVSAWDNINYVIFMQMSFVPGWMRHFQDAGWGDADLISGLQEPPCDFFLWGWAKDEVYRTKPRTLEQLEAVCHQQYLTRLPPEDLGNVSKLEPWRNLCYKINERRDEMSTLHFEKKLNFAPFRKTDCDSIAAKC
ncbi:hypothetical protein C0J52_23093 [Blattella germanica]|nr:hypothetical protein C0J52_23093 [Blattella germanica]